MLTFIIPLELHSSTDPSKFWELVSQSHQLPNMPEIAHPAPNRTQTIYNDFQWSPPFSLQDCWNTYWNGESWSSWSSWYRMGFAFANRPATISSKPNDLHLVGRDLGGNVKWQRWNGTDEEWYPGLWDFGDIGNSNEYVNGPDVAAALTAQELQRGDSINHSQAPVQRAYESMADHLC
jgi:hypothetical protein